MARYSYLAKVAIAVDQLFNTILAGSPDETLSARTHRKRHNQPWKALRVIIDCIFFWQTAHCYEAWKSEMERAQLPKSYRKNI